MGIGSTIEVTIICDEPAVAASLRSLLRMTGHHPDLAMTLLEAIDAVGSHPDAVVIDAGFKDVPAPEVVRQLRADSRLDMVPIIVYGRSGDLDRPCLAAGADALVAPGTSDPMIMAEIDAVARRWHQVRGLRSSMQEMASEREGNMAVLKQVLPEFVLDELKQSGRVAPRRHEMVAVVFVDIVGFTPRCAGLEPEEVVDLVARTMEIMEEVARAHQVSKIKSLGDCFMGVAGVMTPLRRPAVNAIDCCLGIIDRFSSNQEDVQVRGGVHVGPLVSGIVGRDTWHFDIWGDTVNLAARLQGLVEPGRVGVVASTWDEIGNRYEGSSLGQIPIKGKGEMEVFSIEAKPPPLTSMLNRLKT